MGAVGSSSRAEPEVCPCGRADAIGKAASFVHCCGRYVGHFAEVPAPDAQSLMRSRYCAFVVGDEAYLLATWDRSTRPSSVSPVAGAKWLGLEIREVRAVDGSNAQVEFVARYRTAAGAVRLHERSRFVRRDGRWYYVEGDVP